MDSERKEAIARQHAHGSGRKDKKNLRSCNRSHATASLRLLPCDRFPAKAAVSSVVHAMMLG